MSISAWGAAIIAVTGLVAVAVVHPDSPPTAPSVERSRGALAPAAPAKSPRSTAVPTTSQRGWDWPLRPRPRVMAPFAAPPGPYEPGHRGVDLLSALGATVFSPTRGSVSFVGMVAGTPVLVISTIDGRRTTFQPVTALLPVGSAVNSGTPVGRIAAGLSHCAPATCLHWGVLENAIYLDPLSLVRSHRVRLLPSAPGPVYPGGTG